MQYPGAFNSNAVCARVYFCLNSTCRHGQWVLSCHFVYFSALLECVIFLCPPLVLTGGPEIFWLPLPHRDPVWWYRGHSSTLTVVVCRVSGLLDLARSWPERERVLWGLLPLVGGGMLQGSWRAPTDSLHHSPLPLMMEEKHCESPVVFCTVCRSKMKQSISPHSSRYLLFQGIAVVFGVSKGAYVCMAHPIKHLGGIGNASNTASVSYPLLLFPFTFSASFSLLVWIRFSRVSPWFFSLPSVLKTYP